MRVTIDLESNALDLARRTARHKNTTLGEVISEAIRATYRARVVGDQGELYDLPVSGAGGLQPGVDLDSSTALEERMID